MLYGQTILILLKNYENYQNYENTKTFLAPAGRTKCPILDSIKLLNRLSTLYHFLKLCGSNKGHVEAWSGPGTGIQNQCWKVLRERKRKLEEINRTQILRKYTNNALHKDAKTWNFLRLGLVRWAQGTKANLSSAVLSLNVTTPCDSFCLELQRDSCPFACCN